MTEIKPYFILNDAGQFIAYYESANIAADYHPKAFDRHRNPISEHIRDASAYDQSVVEAFKNNSVQLEPGVYCVELMQVAQIDQREEIVEMPDEKWVPIRDYDGYFVSQFGRVKSYNRATHVGQILKPIQTTNGKKYIVKLYKDGKQHDINIVNLVAENFGAIRKPQTRAELIPIPVDKDWSNAQLSNIRWLTKPAAHAWIHGRSLVLLDEKTNEIEAIYPSVQDCKREHKELFDRCQKIKDSVTHLYWEQQITDPVLQTKVKDFKQNLAVWSIDGILRNEKKLL